MDELEALQLTAYICKKEGLTDTEAIRIVHAGVIDLMMANSDKGPRAMVLEDLRKCDTEAQP